MNNKKNKTNFFYALFFFTFAIFDALPFSLIRDAQTEKFLRDLCGPIFNAAGINSEEVKIYIVNDNSINAFVSQGRNIFINTGLIRKFDNPDALIGVIAHEVGHIVGGHVARSSEEINKASNTILLSYLLGAGAILAGSPEAGQGIIMGGSNAAEKLYLKYSRSQEEAADKYALQYLDKINYPAEGLIKLLEFFDSQNRGYEDYLDEYAQSHPVSRKRIDYLKFNYKKKNNNNEISKALLKEMSDVLSKLEGFIDNPNIIIEKYKNSNSENAKYSKAIALHRIGNSKEAKKLINEIIFNNKNDGFLYELKAQIEFESGDIKNSILSYKQAIKNLSNRDSSQSKIYMASAIILVANKDKDLLEIALTNLKQAKEYEKENPFLFKQLSVVYNKINDEARSMAALAEYNFLLGDLKKSKKYANKAKEKFDEFDNKNLFKQDKISLDDLIYEINLQENADKNNKKN